MNKIPILFITSSYHSHMSDKRKMKSLLSLCMTPNEYRNPFKIKILDQRKSRFFFSKLDFWIFEVKLFPEFWKYLFLLSRVSFLCRRALIALYRATRGFENWKILSQQNKQKKNRKKNLTPKMVLKSLKNDFEAKKKFFLSEDFWIFCLRKFSEFSQKS